MNGFISALAAQFAPQPVSPAVDGFTPRPTARRTSMPPCAQRAVRVRRRRPRAPWQSFATGGPIADVAPRPAGRARPPQPEGGFAGEMQARLVLSGQAWQLMSVMCCPRDRRHGNVCLRCALGSSAMARCSRNAFPGGYPWQVFRFMHPKRGFGQEKHPFLATYRRHVSKMSWLWQDMRAMYPKSPANRLSGMHGAQILPGRGPFRCTDPSNHAWRADPAAIQRS